MRRDPQQFSRLRPGHWVHSDGNTMAHVEQQHPLPYWRWWIHRIYTRVGKQKRMRVVGSGKQIASGSHWFRQHAMARAIRAQGRAS